VIRGYDHVQVAIPRGGEADARAYYGAVLGMTEVAKPAVLAGRGGCWFTSGSAVLHLGVEEPFVPARKAHPAFLVDDLAATSRVLVDAGYECTPAEPLPIGESDTGHGHISLPDPPSVERFHTFDPFGNRLEFQQA
jgi:catechol 2,3-dioxygenase-like lactoylglutathione lyase family enzyme